ncbi:MAG: NRDE family protein [Desulfobacterales bacterium]
MCLIAIAIARHPEYPLIIAANRDEFYSRPTAPLDYWEDKPHILAGRDLQSLGTWLGITTSGRIGAITNYRHPDALNQKSKGPSRGDLVREYLAGSDPPQSYIEAIRPLKDQYSGFNLIVGETTDLWWYCNVSDEIRKLTPGIHGISNHLLNTPWPKVEKIKSALAGILAENRPIDPERLFKLLSDQKQPPDPELPDTGIGLEWERILSPVFITSEIYGTRSSSVIFVDRSGHATFYERTYTPQTDAVVTEETRRFAFNIENPVYHV